MADLQEMVGLDLEAQTNPVLGKMQKSGSLQIYLWLKTKQNKKTQKSAKGRHFMQNQGALYVPIQADIGASWGLWGLPVPMVDLSGE